MAGLLYFVGSGVLGLIWPVNSWQCGLWMAGPVIILALISLAFVGGADVFLEKGLPIHLLILVSACAGGIVLPFLKNLVFKKQDQ
jgi:peptidoglycan/LPS O-acetylase OafA/YrhL